uniref:Solute carrier family 22 member 7a n=1 Tax=Erpetoichthys calabaricus TaxID=27687 RepID=A0A8C4SUH0_ERPCA
MRFEELLSEVGGFSWFQLRIVLLLCIPRIILPFHFLLHNFISAVPSHRCSLYPSENASTFYMDTERLKGSIPREADGSLSSCRAFLPQQSTNASEGPSALLPCQYGWVYDKSQLTSTTATEVRWDLVCDNKTQNQVLATYFFIGVTLGAIIFGYCSDKFGWKAMLLVLFVASAIFGTMSAFSVSYVMFAVTRTLCGVALTGMSIISIVLSLEWIDVKHHTFTGTIIGLSWNVGSMLLALVAYFIRDWRHLLLAVTSPCILAIISWWIPESVRWQVTNRHITKAHKQLLNCAKMNGKHQFISVYLQTISKITFAEDSIQNYSYVHLVKTPKMRRLCLLCVHRFGVALSYYGISLKISGFGVNIYLTQFIYGAIEVPAKCATYFALNKIGRRKGQAWSLIITASCCSLVLLSSPDSLKWIRTFIAVLGKGFSEASFTIAFLYTAELFPTVLRQSGLGYTSFMGRMGVSLAPLVIILEDIWSSLPSAIFSTAAILCGCTAFLLSETHNFRLPETVADVEQDK